MTNPEQKLQCHCILVPALSQCASSPIHTHYQGPDTGNKTENKTSHKKIQIIPTDWMFLSPKELSEDAGRATEQRCYTI